MPYEDVIPRVALLNKVNVPSPLITVPSAAICRKELLFTVKSIMLFTVPPDVYVCIPAPLKMIAPLPVEVSVIVPPVWEKFPAIFNVAIELLLLIFKVPPVKEKSPSMVTLLTAVPPVIVKQDDPACVKAPLTVRSPVSFTPKTRALFIPELFVDVIMKLPATSTSLPDRLISLFCDAQFQIKFPKGCVSAGIAGALFIIPVIRQFEVGVQVAEGIDPPSLRC